MPLFLKRSKLKLQSVDRAGNNALVRRDMNPSKNVAFFPSHGREWKKSKESAVEAEANSKTINTKRDESRRQIYFLGNFF